jgi:hypothetical protein
VIGHFKSERSLGNAIYFAEEIPACIVEKGFAVRKEELKIAYLGRINGGVIDLGEPTAIFVPCVQRGSIPGPPERRANLETSMSASAVRLWILRSRRQQAVARSIRWFAYCSYCQIVSACINNLACASCAWRSWWWLAS